MRTDGDKEHTSIIPFSSFSHFFSFSSISLHPPPPPNSLYLPPSTRFCRWKLIIILVGFCRRLRLDFVVSHTWDQVSATKKPWMSILFWFLLFVAHYHGLVSIFLLIWPFTIQIRSLLCILHAVKALSVKEIILI